MRAILTLYNRRKFNFHQCIFIKTLGLCYLMYLLHFQLVLNLRFVRFINYSTIKYLIVYIKFFYWNPPPLYVFHCLMYLLYFILFNTPYRYSSNRACEVSGQITENYIPLANTKLNICVFYVVGWLLHKSKYRT